MTSIIINPDANPETSSVDGTVFKNDSNNWTTTHDAADGSGVDDTSTENIIVGTGIQTGGNYFIWRGFLLFSLASIPAGSTINSATFSFYATSKLDQDNDGQDYIALVGSTPASNTGLVVGDYDQIGTTKYATDIDLGTISTSAYNDWTLNATGIAALQTALGSGGVAKLGLREGHDLENAAYVGAQNTFNRMGGYFADNASNKPKLTIEYSQPSFFLMF